MPFALTSQYKLPHLPIWTATMDIDFSQYHLEYFPPTGFLYLNMYALAGMKRQPDIAWTDSASDGINLRWKIDVSEGIVKSCQIVTGGILTKGPAVMECIGRGHAAILVLHPIIAYHFMRDRLDIVTNGFADLRDLIGKEGELFKCQMEDGMVHSWEDEPVLKFLLNRIGEQQLWQHDPIFHAVNLIIEKKGLIKVKALAVQVFMSERKLERQFLEKVGVSPKTYANIWRFQNALKLLQFRGIERLGEIVQQAGYYDISHFMKDLKQKTGDGFEYFLRQTPELLQAYLKVIEEK